MRIRELTAFEVHLPLRREVKHASATRHESENLVVRCRLGDGTVGWGEGVPREYVTGESVAGAFEQLERTPLGEQLGGECDDWDAVIALCEGFRPVIDGADPRGCSSNALRCAVELSVLDAFGKLFGEPVGAVTARFGPAAAICTRQPRVRYSGAIMAEGRMREAISAVKMRANHFAQCKVKVGVPGANDAGRLRRIRRLLGRRMDVRVDANEAWSAAEAAGRIEPLLPYRITCVEQPVPHEEVAGLAEVRRKVPVPLMLDESLTSQADADAAIAQKSCDLFNIRLSKCGGFLNSLRLAAMAREHGLGYQLGCHPGESGILSAAGRHWAATVGGIRYLEGSYDRHLLGERLTEQDLTFGYGGWAPAIDEPGLGITVHPSTLAMVCRREQVFAL